MRQGAIKHALADRRDDLYETPPAAVHALLRVERLPEVIWEPCAGRGAIVRELKAAGHRVVAQDLVAYDGADPGIETPIEFLLEWKAPPGCTCIVTNPPYKLADEFIRHGLQLVPTVICLLRAMYVEGAGRSDLIDWHLRYQWLGAERLPMMHRASWNGPKLKNGAMPFAWFVFSAERKLTKAFVTERISWREPA